MMAIEKNEYKSPRFVSDFSPADAFSEEDDEDIETRSTRMVADFVDGGEDGMEVEGEGDDDIANDDADEDEDELNDADSGAGSDDFDLLELGDSGSEFCQIANVTCSVPFELFDISGLEDVLCSEAWNELLTDEERFELTKFLPEMDQLTFMRTLKELFEGDNFHFGSPMKKLFHMLKAGLCEPRVSLYREGLIMFQKRQHYHFLRNHHNSMISNLCLIRDAWSKCKSYSVEEKLRVLNIMKNQKSLMYEKLEEGIGSDSLDESIDGVRGKRSKKRKNLACVSGPAASPKLASRMPLMNHGKSNSNKGKSKVADANSYDKFLSSHEGLNYGLAIPSSHYGKVVGYDMRMRPDYEDEDETADPMYEMKYPGNTVRDSGVIKSGIVKGGKEIGHGRNDTETFMGLAGPLMNDFSVPSDHRSKSVVISKLNGYPGRSPNIQSEYERRASYSHFLHQYAANNRSVQMPLPNCMYGVGSYPESSWHPNYQGQSFPLESSRKKVKKSKKGRRSPDVGFELNQSTSQAGDAIPSEFKTKSSKEKVLKVAQKGGLTKSILRVMYTNNGETESDSSEYLHDEDEDNSTFKKKIKIHRSIKTGVDSKNTKTGKEERLDDDEDMIQSAQISGKDARFNDLAHITANSSKGKRKASTQYCSGGTVDDNASVSRGKQKSSIKINKLGQLKVESDRNSPEGANESQRHDEYPPTRMVKKRVKGERHVITRTERSETSLHQGCSSTSKKQQKLRDGDTKRIDVIEDDCGMQFTALPMEETISSKKKGKRKLESDAGTVDTNGSQLNATEPGTPVPSIDIEAKPIRKPYSPITPTVHTCFSFSVVHLLTAVRMAMTTPLSDSNIPKDEEIDRSFEGETNPSIPRDGANIGNESEDAGQSSLPHLTIKEIVNHVKVNPCDTSILETQEPLQDLVRGVLKILSSKTAPLGAKGWKPLVRYERSNKTWSWVGPLSITSPDLEINEVTSPEYWNLPHKMLVKVVDSFANWLKCGQETLQQIGTLPEPPLSLMQCNMAEKERFRDLRAQKSLNTISPSHEEVRTYFRKEEFLRYSVPDRAFLYTAADGKKTIVAPLRRCGGKPTSKARDHFMLKRDRPPHVTILCLVRDAAARLPASIGTRADVCTLIRDSQYIVEEVSDAQVNQVVSGALDRLHYERDPCVQFDAERKLWVYLHRDREEEDFEDDGTSSTKKWKRQKKDSSETEMGAVTVAFHGLEDQPGFDLESDLNVEPPGTDGDKKSDNGESVYEQGNLIQDDSLTWETHNLNPEPESKLLC